MSFSVAAVQRRGTSHPSGGAAIPMAAPRFEGAPQFGDWEEPAVRRSTSLDTAKLETDGRSTVFVAQPMPAWLERTHFETSSMPGAAVERVMAAVQAAGGEISCVKPHKSKVKCSIFKDFTMVNFHITVYRNISQNPTAPYILEFQKRGGDSFTWNSVCTTLLESLRDLSATRIPVANIEAEAKQLRIIDGIHPQELAALAAGMVSIEGGHQETHCIAARAYGVAAATLEARRLAGKGEAGEHIWGNESAAAKKHRIEDSLQALRDVKDESGEIARYCAEASYGREFVVSPASTLE